MYQVYKIDVEYIVLAEDAPIPAVGEATYSKTVTGALQTHANLITEFGSGLEVDRRIKINEYADAALIEAARLEPA